MDRDNFDSGSYGGSSEQPNSQYGQPPPRSYVQQTSAYGQPYAPQPRGFSPGQQPNVQNPGGHPGAPTNTLSAQDMMTLKQCNKESFWYRCLPFMVVGNGLTVARNISTGNAWGRGKSISIHMFVSFGCWVFGKITYRAVCEDKLINSDSTSEFIQRLRERKGLVRRGEPYVQAGFSNDGQPTRPEFGQQRNDDFTGSGDSSFQSSSPYGEPVTPHQGFGSQSQQEFYKPRFDKFGQEIVDETENKEKLPIVTYDSLREQNRRAAQSRPNARPAVIVTKPKDDGDTSF